MCGPTAVGSKLAKVRSYVKKNKNATINMFFIFCKGEYILK